MELEETVKVHILYLLPKVCQQLLSNSQLFWGQTFTY